MAVGGRTASLYHLSRRPLPVFFWKPMAATGSGSKTGERLGEKKRNVTFPRGWSGQLLPALEPEGLELFLLPAYPHFNFLAYRGRYRACCRGAIVVHSTWDTTSAGWIGFKTGLSR